MIPARIHHRGNNGERPPRTAGMRAKTDASIEPMKPTPLLWRLFGVK